MGRPGRIEEFDKNKPDPLESLRLECCDLITLIPISREEEFIHYSGHYLGDCPSCGREQPKWSWPSRLDGIKIIKTRYDPV